MKKRAQESDDSFDLDQLLRQHSRTFSLTLFALPGQKRQAVSLTYLVARLADTIADASTSDIQRRIEALQSFRKQVLMNLMEDEQDLSALDGLQFTHPKEQILIQNQTLILEAFQQLPTSERELAQKVLEELFAAMEKLLAAQKSSVQPVFVNPRRADFDHYCYQHAGCVGKFWVEIFDLDLQQMKNAVDYGVALERINILRDVIEDSQAGLILLCQEDLDKFGLQSLEPWKEKGWSNFVEAYAQETFHLLKSAAIFCDSVPYHRARLRWASMMPLKIALASLSLYQKEKMKTETSKISRKQVRSLVWESVFDSLFHRRIGQRLLIKSQKR